jgi:cell division septation protein DedD
MKRFSAVILSVSMVVLLLAGCSSSDQSGGQQQSQSTPPSTSAPLSSEEITKKSDTLNVNVQNTQRPAYNQQSPSTTQQPPTSGKYSVQIGAYKQADNADRIASLARERFGKNVYTIPDKVNDLYKVTVGDFTIKDDARKFRDEMVQKFPYEYKDAWVTELPQK